MNAEMKNDILRQVLFMTMIESLKNYEKHGILDEVEQAKKEKDIVEGPAKVKTYGITDTEQFLKFSSDTFNCAHWSIEKDESGFTAITKSCVACGMAKQQNAPSPCNMTCISPVRGVIKGLNENNKLDVQETLWDGKRCVFKVSC